MLGFVRKTYFILQKYNKMHLRVVAPSKLISPKNEKTRAFYFIIACNIYFLQIFRVEIMPVWKFVV